MIGRPKIGETNPTVEATCYSRQTRLNRIFATLIEIMLSAKMTAKTI